MTGLPAGDAFDGIIVLLIYPIMQVEPPFVLSNNVVGGGYLEFVFELRTKIIAVNNQSTFWQSDLHHRM